MDNKVVKHRADLVESMNLIISSCNNEDAYCTWIYLVPDEADRDDFADIAEDEELYAQACTLFRDLIVRFGKDGFYVVDDDKAF